MDANETQIGAFYIEFSTLSLMNELRKNWGSISYDEAQPSIFGFEISSFLTINKHISSTWELKPNMTFQILFVHYKFCFIRGVLVEEWDS